MSLILHTCCHFLLRVTTAARARFIPILFFLSFRQKLNYLIQLFTSCKSKMKVVSIDWMCPWSKWYMVLVSFGNKWKGVFVASPNPRGSWNVWTKLREQDAVCCQPSQASAWALCVVSVFPCLFHIFKAFRPLKLQGDILVHCCTRIYFSFTSLGLCC